MSLLVKQGSEQLSCRWEPEEVRGRCRFSGLLYCHELWSFGLLLTFLALVEGLLPLQGPVGPKGYENLWVEPSPTMGQVKNSPA